MNKLLPQNFNLSGIVALLFLLMFCGMGLWCGWQVFTTIHATATSRDWVETPATLKSWSIETTTGTMTPRGISDRSSYIIAEYTYIYEGNEFVGKRVGFENFINDIGSSTRNRRLEILELASMKPENFKVFVNGENPAQAVIDRSLPTEALLSVSCFMLLCSLWLSILYGFLLRGLQYLLKTKLDQFQMSLTGILHGGIVIPIYAFSDKASWDASSYFMGLILLTIMLTGAYGLLKGIRKSRVTAP